MAAGALSKVGSAAYKQNRILYAPEIIQPVADSNARVFVDPVNQP
jgi:hypothetical protein